MDFMITGGYMTTNLREILQDTIQNDFIDVRSRPATLASIIRNHNMVSGEISGLVPKINEKILKMLLLELPMPAIYLLEHQDTTYEVIQGIDILNTAAAVIVDHAEFEPRSLVRRIIETEVTLVTLRCNMTTQVIDKLKDLMGLS